MRLNISRWVRPFLILALVVAIPWIVYWFGYVQGNVSAQRRQAYATLSALTSDFRERLLAYDNISANAGSYVVAGPKAAANYLNSLLKINLKGSVTTIEGKGLAHLAIDAPGGGLTLNVGDPRSEFCKPEGCSTFRTVVPLENLVPWNVVETEFDGLLVLDAKGFLVAQDRRLPAQARGVRVPLQLHGKLPDFSAIIDGTAAPPDAQKPDGVADLSNMLFDFRDDSTIQLAGVNYVGFMQVVSAPVTSLVPDGRVEPVRMVVVGLIAQDRLRREAIQLSPHTFLLVATLLAFGMFAIPFLKLRFIGERDRMQARDVWLLSGSILSTTAVLTLIILDTHAHYYLRKSFDTGLKSFSGEVAGHLAGETNAALTQLSASAADLVHEPATSGLPRRCADGGRSLPEAAPIGSILTQRDLTTYPNFEALIATDLCGNQVRKWMARTLTTRNIPLADQSYFPPALTQSADPGAPTFTFGSTLAPTSGLILGVLAQPFDASTPWFGPQAQLERRSGIIAVALPLRSLSTPVVAQPFQFVLVDRHGAVTFQKSKLAFRGERFFESVRGGSALERAAQIADPRPQTYEYRGHPYRMMAIDLPQLQLTLVTFYETSVIDHLTARVFSTAAAFALGIVASMLLGAAIAATTFRGLAFDWAWPSISRTPHYIAGIVLCLVSILILLLARSYLSSDFVGWLMLAAPMVIIVLLGTGWVTSAVDCILERTGIKSKQTDTTARAWLLMSRTYTLFAVMALMAFVAWPTWIAFKDAFNLHATELSTEIAYAWRSAADQMRATDDQSLVKIEAPLAAPDCEQRPDIRCVTPERTYATAANYEKLRATRDQYALYETCADLGDARPSCVADSVPPAPFSVTVDVANWLSALTGDPAEHGRTLSTFIDKQDDAVRAPLWQARHGSVPWSLAGIALVFIALWLLVRSIATHVLGIRVTDRDPPDDSASVKPEDGTIWLLLRPAGPLLSKMREAATDQTDLCSTRREEVFPCTEAGRKLLVEHLEAQIPRPECRAAALSLFDTRHAGCVIVTSEIEPLDYLTQRLREKSNELYLIPPDDKERRVEAERQYRELRDEVARWAMALSTAQTVRPAMPPFPARPTGVDPAFYAKLAEECSGTWPVIEIGSRLLERRELATCRWEDVVSVVLDEAEPYYRSVWELCSQEERLVLIQLAQVGLVNPKREEIVRRLARRGLVKVDPRYRMMNQSFQRFVRSAEPREQVVEWERTGSTTSWANLGTPLYVLAAMVIAVLLFAEQGLFTNILAVATGGAATLGSLRTMYASITKGAPPGKPS